MHEAFYKPLFKSMYRFGETLRRSAISAFFLPSRANCMMALIWVGSFSIASRDLTVSSSQSSRKKHLFLAVIFAHIRRLPSNTQVR